MVELYTLSVIAFASFVVFWLIKDRKNIDRKFVVFLRRTQKGKKFIYRTADAFPRLWAFIGDLGIVAGFIGMFYILFFMITQAYLNLSGQVTGSSLSLIVPIVSTTSSSGSFWVGVPFWDFIISIAFLISIHEGFHGIQTRIAGVNIKSLGLALIAILPGAFVEPDDKKLNKKSLRSRLRVYAAGSAGNFLLALAVFVLIAGLTPAFTEGAVKYKGYVDSSVYDLPPFPAEETGVKGYILSIDGQRTEGIDDYTRILSEQNPGDSVTLTTTEGVYDVTLASHPQNESVPFLGIGGVVGTDGYISIGEFSNNKILKERYRESSAAPLIESVFRILSWMFLLNVGIGLVNLLPLKPFDGGLMFDSLAKRLFPRNSRIAIWSAGMLVLALVLISFFGPRLAGLV